MTIVDFSLGEEFSLLVFEYVMPTKTWIEYEKTWLLHDDDMKNS